MSDLSWNVWGAISAAIGMLLALIPLFNTWVGPRLPSATLPDVRALLKETQKLYATALENGDIDDESEIHDINVSLEMAVAYVDELRAVVYSATSYPQDLKNWWKGISGRIARLYKSLNNIRVKLVKKSSLERKMRISMNFDVDFSADQEHDLSPPPRYTPSQHIACASLPQPKVAATHSTCAVSQDPNPVSLSCSDSSRPGTELDISDLRIFVPGGDTATFAPNRHSTRDHRPIYHVISDIDLQNLLSLAAARSAIGQEAHERQRATQNLKAAFRHLSDQLCDPSHSPTPRHSAPLKWHPKRTRLRTIIRLLRRACGVQQPGVGIGGASTLDAHIDPESLRSQDFAASDVEESAWEDQ